MIYSVDSKELQLNVIFRIIAHLGFDILTSCDAKQNKQAGNYSVKYGLHIHSQHNVFFQIILRKSNDTSSIITVLGIL